jgi:hypothetical protein
MEAMHAMVMETRVDHPTIGISQKVNETFRLFFHVQSLVLYKFPCIEYIYLATSIASSLRIRIFDPRFLSAW